MTPRRTDSSPSPARNSKTTQKPRPLRARSGRRPGDSGTREQILESALHLFADRGYARTTIRAIAEDAQVDPALVHHFFDNKEGVFDAAVNSSLSVSSVFDGMVVAAPETQGDPGDTAGSAGDPADGPKQGTSAASWLARTYLTFWESEDTRYAMTAIYRAGLADSATADTLRARVEASTKSWAAQSGYKDGPEADTRAALASGHLVGLALMRYVLGIHPLATMEFEEFLAWVVPALELRLSPDLAPQVPEDQGE
ncbi:TetR family transcriptional regulator [Streptomyces sp. AC512_CC834]|uniref:TetR/AcrR family transcriptional regulator n=1 Tax=Streptomyces sp. AC512_CC834 TaxID=2823691 RepID=UPI001C267E22|nr:TetR family transcriptional regulator [Streptomyces sp. AC512_CC834]